MLPGIIGTIQALEAVKVILGAGEPLIGRLMLFDSLGLRFREVRLRRDPACPACGDHPTIRTIADAGQAGGGCALPAQAAAAVLTARKGG